MPFKKMQGNFSVANLLVAALLVSMTLATTVTSPRAQPELSQTCTVASDPLCASLNTLLTAASSAASSGQLTTSLTCNGASCNGIKATIKPFPASVSIKNPVGSDFTFSIPTTLSSYSVTSSMVITWCGVTTPKVTLTLSDSNSVSATIDLQLASTTLIPIPSMTFPAITLISTTVKDYKTPSIGMYIVPSVSIANNVLTGSIGITACMDPDCGTSNNKFYQISGISTGLPTNFYVPIMSNMQITLPACPAAAVTAPAKASGASLVTTTSYTVLLTFLVVAMFVAKA